MGVSDFMNMTVKNFSDALASGEPAPGGGSASAQACANAAALMAMYCRLTIGRKKFQAVEEKISQAAANLDRCRERLLELVDLDAKAYGGVMAGFAMPKGTDEEKKARKEAIQAGLQEAAKVPMETCTWAVKLLQTASAIFRDGNENALTDLGVGVQLAMAGFAGAALNVYVNLADIADETFVVSSQKTVHDLETEARRLSATMAADIYMRLNVDGE
jgi:formiminotetrahydrofolate cyclodeaminase